MRGVGGIVKLRIVSPHPKVKREPTRMEIEMYMDGTGIQERTDQLTDKVWDTLGLALMGAPSIVLGPLLSWGLLILQPPGRTPPTEFDWGLAITIAVASVAVGLKMYLPHHRARTALNRHSKNMERETAQRGKGWERS